MLVRVVSAALSSLVSAAVKIQVNFFELEGIPKVARRPYPLLLGAWYHRSNIRCFSLTFPLPAFQVRPNTPPWDALPCARELDSVTALAIIVLDKVAGEELSTTVSRGRAQRLRPRPT